MKPVFNEQRILSILLDDHIYPFIHEDSGPRKEDFIFKVKNELFFMDEDNRSCFIVYPYTSQNYWMHAHILPQYRQDKYLLAAMFFDAVRQFTKAKRLMASIPRLYLNIITYSQKCGFTKHHDVKEAYLKNGECHDLQVMIKDLYQ